LGSGLELQSLKPVDGIFHVQTFRAYAQRFALERLLSMPLVEFANLSVDDQVARRAALIGINIEALLEFETSHTARIVFLERAKLLQ
jgi:hypothetical protein